MNKWLAAIIWAMVAASLGAQSTAGSLRPVSITVFNHATLLPGAGVLGVWGVPAHPGFSVGTEFRYNRHPKNEWFQTVRMGYFYHRYVQHGIQLYSEAGYRYHFGASADLESRLGAGYLHSIPAAQVFEFSENGTYVRHASIGRPQAMVSLSLGGGDTFPNMGKLRLFLAYQVYLPMPLRKGDVPVFPNSAPH
ncbi:MAG TPA: hypothetical protein PKB07_09550, partial [Flavilitoribacter sp.]|nr:hypothetical protein [Flavilitoribacter sp.]